MAAAVDAATGDSMKAGTVHVVLTPESAEEYTFIKALIGEGNEGTITLSLSLSRFRIPPARMFLTLDPSSPDDLEYWQEVDRIKKEKQEELERAIAELDSHP